MRIRATFLTLLTSVVLGSLAAPALPAQAAAAKSAQDSVLKASEVTPALFPDRVFFRGKTGIRRLHEAGKGLQAAVKLE